MACEESQDKEGGIWREWRERKRREWGGEKGGLGESFGESKKDSTWFKTRAKLVREIQKDCEGVESFAFYLLSTLNPAHF